MSHLWIGTYPVAGAGTPVGLGEGIWRVGLVEGVVQDPRQLVATPSPSFLALHPSGTVLYAANEQTDGTVTAFDVVGETLVVRETVSSGGADPCHLLLDTDGGALLVANYSSGSLAVLPLDAAGGFTDEVRVLGHVGSGSHPQRQEGPHAHFVAHAPGGWVLVVDLGTDEIRRYRRGPDGLQDDGIAVAFEPGTGPRHLAFAADGRHAYVVGELDVTVRVLAWDAATGTGTLVQTVPAITTRTEDALPSHVLLDGRRLLVGTRTADVVAEFTTADDGLLEHVADHALPGRWPRHLEVVDGWTVVAEQVSGDLAVLSVDGSVRGSWPLPSPACVLPVRR
ncbi:lactonase family protein [Cellulomonas sp. McL0617]|uniref:lactonase family protein n=1 Tax=Cellulomonas sp. McL0617 TaxID=3415675 RepID=UPI003CE8DC6D